MFDIFDQLTIMYSQNSRAVTIICCAIIVVFTFVMLKLKGQCAEMVPGMAVSTGIFFTFLGLAFSLSAASNHGIEGRFNALVGGLSTAFWTSVVGMGISIGAKVVLAYRIDQSPLNQIESEFRTLRQSIAGLGDDINRHLSANLNNALDQYVHKVESLCDASVGNIASIQHSLDTTFQSLDKAMGGLVQKAETMITPVADLVETTQDLTGETRTLLEQNAKLVAQQAKWTQDIESSLGSIAHLAPEAKLVFEAVDTINSSYVEYKAAIETSLQSTQQHFGKDIEKITNEAINRMIGIDSEHHEKVVHQLEKMDKVLENAFDVALNQFGQGFVDLSKKKLELIAGIVVQLEAAAEYFKMNPDPLDNSPDESEKVVETRENVGALEKIETDIIQEPEIS